MLLNTEEETVSEEAVDFGSECPTVGGSGRGWVVNTKQQGRGVGWQLERSEPKAGSARPS